MRLLAVRILFLLPLAIGLLARCGASDPGSVVGPPEPDPADAPRLAGVSPGADRVRIEVGSPLEFRIEATSPRSRPLRVTYLVDGVPRATAASFVFEPPAEGTYRVTAVVSDGELETVREWTVEVEPPPNAPPTAALGVEPGSGTAPLAARFRVEGADPDGTVVRWRLELVGPEPIVVEREAPIDTVLVLGAGEWQATAIVEDDAGGTAVATRAVPVAAPNRAPAATLRVDPAAGPAPLDAFVEGDGVDPDGSIVRFRLDLDGDGGFEVESPDPIRRPVRFEAVGTRWVRLAVTDDRGAEARDSVLVRVDEPAPSPPPPANAPPAAELVLTPADGEAPLEVRAAATGSDADGAVALVRIDFDEDGAPDASGPGPGLEAAFIYAAPGTRTVRATVVDDRGASATAEATVTVRAATNAPPAGSLALDVTSGDAPLAVVVAASGSDPDGSVVRWEVEASEGDGFLELDDSRTATLVYPFDESVYRPRLRLTDDDGASTVVEGPPVTVYRPVAGGSGSVAGNPRFDATGIAPGVWSDGSDPWRLRVTVRDPVGEPLAGVPLRATPTRDPLSAPDGTPLGPGVVGPGPLVTGADGTAAGTLRTSLSTRIEAAPVVGFRGFDLVVEADAGHGQWRPVTRLEGLNANTTVAAATSRVVLRPANQAVCPGTPVEVEVRAVSRPDAPSPGAPTPDRFTVLRYTDGTILDARPAPGWGDWRTDGQGVVRFAYVPTRADQGKLVQAWVDGQPIDELIVLALQPPSQCEGS